MPIAAHHSEHHHGSHRGLLHTALKTSPEAHVDAIIVPTIRPPRAMKHAISLAASLNCVLVALCSKKFTSAAAVATRASAANVEVLAIDVDALPPAALPHFRTCAQLENTRFERRNDISRKRNLGLLVARVAGWDRIVFLDDDIEIPDPGDLRRAAALTDRYAGAGLNIHGHPDNSVVCHAYREAGGAQDQFIGGGALAVHTRETSSFFPNIYNEDWFFLLNGEKLRPTAVTGVAVQKPYDPFADDERARMEELGDVLAEGLYWLLDEDRPLGDANAGFWSRYLSMRQDFIRETVDMVRQTERNSERRARKVSSLTAALGRSRYIRPEWCEAYVQAWRADRKTWQDHVAHLQPGRRHSYGKDELGKVIAHLGWTFQSTYLPSRPAA
ncbi:hypothetical protein [Lentzea sp.]|uniref:hypothetical protein n=1 Tax=Lentzea sp. TaxID=56099 RepID=UPI002CF7BFC3|nr:hypothetical protein [Lentzea sp.]HUQ58490.1 hypothetical protein [Lentzea sp.]